MGFSLIFAWLADKIGGTLVGEKAKQYIPSLNKAKKEVAQARLEAAGAQRNWGRAEKEVELLLEEIDYQREVIIYLAGCRDTLEHHCRNEGINLPREFPPPKPRRKTATEKIRSSRPQRPRN